MKVLALLIVSVVVTENAWGQTSRSSPAAIQDSLLSRGYDWRDRPRRYGHNDPPTNITVNVFVRRLNLIGQELDAEITLRQIWHDHRLSYARDFSDGPEYLHVYPGDKSERRIWTPDTFFNNAYDLKVESVPSRNEMLRVRKDGEVYSSQKISLKTTCPMEFDRFPNDVQTCTLDFSSYANTVQDIVYDWQKENPVHLKTGIEKSLPDFTLESAKPEPCDTQKTSTGEYGCMRIVFTFRRKQAAISSKLYLIPLLLALLSLLPMILNAQSIILRVVIGFFCLSTLIVHWSIIGEELPKVGYSTGAEFWLTRCLAFIAATFIQLIFFYWISRVVESRRDRRLIKEKVAKEKLILTKKDGTEEDVILIHTEPVVPERKVSLGLLVDLISLAIFILAFLVFLLHYYTKY